MEPDEILARLDMPYASYQWEAMDAAVDQETAMAPLLLRRLESAAADPEALLDTDAGGLLYTLALLAHFRETAAHQPLLRLASWPEDTIDALLGDAITELLPAVLWRTSADETDGLRRLLEDRSAYGFCRGAAGEALTWGARFGDLDYEAIETYLLSLLDDETFAEHGDPAWYCVFHSVLNLYPQAHEGHLRKCAHRKHPFVQNTRARPRLDTARAARAGRPAPAGRCPRLPFPLGGLPAGLLGRRGHPCEPVRGRGTGAEMGPDSSTKRHKRKQRKKAREANRKRKTAHAEAALALTPNFRACSAPGPAWRGLAGPPAPVMADCGHMDTRGTPAYTPSPKSSLPDLPRAATRG